MCICVGKHHFIGSLTPSALRGNRNRKTGISEPLNYEKRIGDYKHHIALSLKRTKSFCDRDPDIMEPLLQHYCIKTYWLDFVDNVWVALWFALHKTTSTIIDNREYIHIYENDANESAYVFLVGCDATKESQTQPGLYEGSSSVVVDLRKAIPLIFFETTCPTCAHGKKERGTFIIYGLFRYGNRCREDICS